MSKKINNLITSISDTIKEFAGGKLSFEETKNEYIKLENIYKSLENNQKKNNGTNLINGLCYYNNIENFSLLSGVYNITKDDINKLTYHGDNNLNDKTEKIILDNFDNLEKNKILKIPPDSNGIFSNNIYIYPLLFDKLSRMAFVSVSSSTFFSNEKFSFSGRLFKNLFSLVSHESNLFEQNYFDEVSKEISNYINMITDAHHTVRVTLYVFNMVVKIFNHMGVDTLLEVSDKISQTLNNNYKHNSKCFTLSIRDYVIVQKTTLEKIKNEKKKKEKIDFICKDINIPYHTLTLDLETNDSLHNIWNKILTFENYLTTGDGIQ